jgi:hypothetical protein
MESNIDGYLDWYYSLSGEYTRLAKLLTGEIEKYMEEELVEKLKQEDALKPVVAALEVALANHIAIAEEYQKDVKGILANNHIQVPDFGAKGIPGIASDRILVLPTHLDVVTMKSRVVGGAAATGIGAAVVAKIVSKGVLRPLERLFQRLQYPKGRVLLVGPQLVPPLVLSFLAQAQYLAELLVASLQVSLLTRRSLG